MEKVSPENAEFSDDSYDLPVPLPKKMKEQEIIGSILDKYDWRVRPHGQNKSNKGSNIDHQ